MNNIIYIYPVFDKKTSQRNINKLFLLIAITVCPVLITAMKNNFNISFFNFVFYYTYNIGVVFISYFSFSFIACVLFTEAQDVGILIKQPKIIITIGKHILKKIDGFFRFEKSTHYNSIYNSSLVSSALLTNGYYGQDSFISFYHNKDLMIAKPDYLNNHFLG